MHKYKVLNIKYIIIYFSYTICIWFTQKKVLRISEKVTFTETKIYLYISHLFNLNISIYGGVLNLKQIKNIFLRAILDSKWSLV